MTNPQDLKRRIREGRKALKASICTCHPHKHDPYWVQCPKTLAEIELENALAAAGFVL